MTPRLGLLSCLLAAAAFAANPPAITEASPEPIDAGGPYFLITITGTGFASGAVATLAGTPLATTFVSATELRAAITPELRAVSGHPALVVVNPGGAFSNPRTIRILPVLAGFSPAAVLAGSPAVTLAVRGIGLKPGQVLVWSAAGNPAAIATQFVDSTRITATVPAGFLAAAASVAIQIADPPCDLYSAALPFDVLTVPAIESLSANPVDAGGAYFRVSVNGIGFVPSSVVNLSGTPLDTTYISSTRLDAAITPELRALAGTFPVTVSHPGIATSAAAQFTVSPVLFGSTPASAPAGGPAVNLTATGVGFTRDNLLAFNGAALPTTFVNSTLLTAVIPPASLRLPGAAAVQVISATGPGRSLPVFFYVISVPVPTISALSPASATSGSPAFTLTITGTNCPAACVVQWNGAPLATTHPSDTTTLASVSANLIASAGAASIRLVNQYGAASDARTFVINPPAAVLSNLSPASIAAGSPTFYLTLYGSGFVPGALALWNGAGVPTTFMSPTQLTAYITADLLAPHSGLNAALTVQNPGGAVSNSVAFAIDPPHPSILSLYPAAGTAGASEITFAITGANFAANCVVRWNGTPVGAVFADAGRLTVTVPGSLLGTPGAFPITVTNPSGLATNSTAFTLSASAPAVDSLAPSSLPAGSPAFTLTVNGSLFTTSAAVQWNGAALATAFVNATRLQASVPANLVAAQATVTITVSNGSALVSRALQFAVVAPPPAPLAVPAVSLGGVVNAFGMQPAIAPGSLISIFGKNLAPAQARAAATPLPTDLLGASVTIAGIAAPLLFVSDTQINAQAPSSLPPGPASLVVRNGAAKSLPVNVDVKPAVPGVFTTLDGTHAVAVNYPGGALNSAQNPVRPGDTVVLYLTGQGLTDLPVPDGAESPAGPFSLPLATVRATLNGSPAAVAFAGLAPGFVGLLQLNLLVPNIPPGEQALEVTVGDAAANRTVLWVAIR